MAQNYKEADSLSTVLLEECSAFSQQRDSHLQEAQETIGKMLENIKTAKT
jgi:hypothetical protein